MRIVVTGAAGLLGWHVASHIHARNCAAQFAGDPTPFDLVRVERTTFGDSLALRQAVAGADVIVHCAGQNRGPEDEIEAANPAMAAALLAACVQRGCEPHLIYTNSIHATADTAYGRSKRYAGELFAASGLPYTDLVLPHVFGEGARANYNNVTATFVHHIITGTRPAINANGQVELVHAGAVAELVLDAINYRPERTRAAGRTLSVLELFEKLAELHGSYERDVFPDLVDPFTVALFNTYRSALYPGGYPRYSKLHDDQRGRLFEAVKTGSGGQTFLSWTEPGETRGNHFHLNKVERFLVLEGQATIRLRPALGSPIHEYRVDGAKPAPVDMPTLFTHSIENTGPARMLTMFWTNEIFDPAAPDTYRDSVLGAAQ